MMSASAMSAMIRAKKKKMEEEHSDAVKLSGIPEDATDILVNKNKEMGEMLSENMPKEHDEDPMLKEDMHAQMMDTTPEMSAPDPMEDDEKMKRHAKIRAMMSRMS